MQPIKITRYTIDGGIDHIEIIADHSELEASAQRSVEHGAFFRSKLGITRRKDEGKQPTIGHTKV